jgi:hypothetical protein
MKTRTHIAHGALVSMAAAVAIGCGGAGASSDSGEQEPKAGADAAIVALAPAAIDGCQLTMTFDISAPSSIGWIAVTNLTQTQGLDANEQTQLALWEIDENQRQHRIQTTAIAASTQLLQLLQQATDTSFLSHVANVAVSDQSNHFMQTATDRRDVSGADATQTHQSDVLNQAQRNDVSSAHEDRNASGATVAAARDANAADATLAAAAQNATLAAQNATSSTASGATSGQSFALGALPAMPIGGVDPAASAAGVLYDAAWTQTGQASEQAAFGAGQAMSSIANRGAGALDAQGSVQRGASTDRPHRRGDADDVCDEDRGRVGNDCDRSGRPRGQRQRRHCRATDPDCRNVEQCVHEDRRAEHVLAVRSGEPSVAALRPRGGVEGESGAGSVRRVPRRGQSGVREPEGRADDACLCGRRSLTRAC